MSETRRETRLLPPSMTTASAATGVPPKSHPAPSETLPSVPPFVATNGGTEGSVSLGAGWLFGGTPVAAEAVVMLGGSKRVSRRVSLITENYLYAGGSSNAVLGYGARFFGDKLSVDLAFLNMAGSGVTPIFPGVPELAFSTRF